MELVVGMGEYIISNNSADTIKTYVLASCIGVTAFSPIRKVAGMLHVVLPAPTNVNESRERPGYYAATGIPLLIGQMCREYGCLKGELEIHLYGGADSIRSNDTFNIGRRNIEMAMSVLSNMYLKIHASDVGGTHSRTLEMDVGTGKIKVFCQSIQI